MLSKNAKKEMVTVRLEPHQRDAILRLAKKYGARKSDVLRDVVEGGILHLLGGVPEDEILKERLRVSEEEYLDGEEVLAALRRNGA
jgi:hypothetical protein